MSRLGPRLPQALALRPRLTVDQLLWVANTRHGPGGHWFARVGLDTGDHDHLQVPADAATYLAAHRVPLPAEPPSRAHLALLRVYRESVRALLDPATPSPPPALDAMLRTTRFRIAPDGGVDSGDEGWDGFLADLALPFLQLVAHRDRLRICGNPHCRLVFLDLSANRTRRWCDSAGCGNRDRVRRHRAGTSLASVPNGLTVS